MSKKECEDHQLWHTHVSFAFWGILGAAWFFIFTIQFAAAIACLAISLLLAALRLRIDRKHYEWHLGQEKEGKHTM